MQILWISDIKVTLKWQKKRGNFLGSSQEKQRTNNQYPSTPPKFLTQCQSVRRFIFGSTFSSGGPQWFVTVQFQAHEGVVVLSIWRIWKWLTLVVIGWFICRVLGGLLTVAGFYLVVYGQGLERRRKRILFGRVLEPHHDVHKIDIRQMSLDLKEHLLDNWIMVFLLSSCRSPGCINFSQHYPAVLNLSQG